jgi:hypothetical protein
MYNIKINKLRLQPLIMINDCTTDIGMWNNLDKVEQELLIQKAIKCYEL